jgi:hypothetical protein
VICGYLPLSCEGPASPISPGLREAPRTGGAPRGRPFAGGRSLACAARAGRPRQRSAAASSRTTVISRASTSGGPRQKNNETISVCAVFGQDLVVETADHSSFFRVAVTAFSSLSCSPGTAHGEALSHRTRALPARTAATGGPLSSSLRCLPGPDRAAHARAAETAIAGRVFCKILLMIVLGKVEFRGGQNLSRDGAVAFRRKRSRVHRL